MSERKYPTRKETISLEFYYKFIARDDELVKSVQIDLFDDGTIREVLDVEEWTTTKLYRVKFVTGDPHEVSPMVCMPQTKIIVEYFV